MARPRLALVAFAVLAFGVQPAAAEEAIPPWAEAVIARGLQQKAPSGTLDRGTLETLRQRGETLFTGHFTGADGVGRPFATQAIVPTKRKRPPQNAFFRSAGLDANACSGCHNMPVAGGAGEFVTNVFVSEGFESADFESLDPQFSNERGTNHLFGAGLVELLSREMTRDLQATRRATLAKARASGKAVTSELMTKGVRFGTITAHPDGMLDLTKIDGVDADLVIRPFTQKGVMTSLRQFTVNALNHHHGIQAVERFGKRWTGEDDFDGDGVAEEIADADIAALVAWQAGLQPPIRSSPEDDDWQKAAERGNAVFDELQCSTCHIRALPLSSLEFADPGPVDMAGTLRNGESEADAVYDLSLLEWAKDLPRDEEGNWLVPLFGDLKRHTIADQEVSAFGNELLAQRFVERNVFMTTELWGLESTAPYGHRNDMTTIDEAIRAHGGEARASRDAYIAAEEADRSALIAFLRTLVIGEVE